MRCVYLIVYSICVCDGELTPLSVPSGVCATCSIYFWLPPKPSQHSTNTFPKRNRVQTQ